MKKFILSALTVGAMAVGGAASAQTWGGVDPVTGVLSQIFGGGSTATPAVVAGANQSIYVDQYGRRFYYDQYGRQVLVDNTTGAQGSYGYGNRTVIDPTGRQVVLDEHNTYRDAYGNRIQVDAYGRHLRLDQYGSYRDPYGRIVYLGADRRPLFLEENGRLVSAGSTSGNGSYAYGGSYGNWDRDGDGVANESDRWPDDSRYR